MLTVLWTSFLALLAGTLSIAWIVALMYEKGVHPVKGFTVFLKKQSKVGVIVFAALFIGFGIIAGTKRNGGGTGTTGVPPVESGNLDPAPDEWEDFTPITSTNTTRTLDADDFRRGFVLSGVGTGEAHDFSAPPGATVCDDWRAFGGAEDWFYVAFTNWSFQVASNRLDYLRIHSDGWAATGTTGVSPVAWVTTLWPFKAPLGVAPEANWPLVSTGGTPVVPVNGQDARSPSQFWHYVTPSNTLQLTWQGALLGLDTNTLVSVQAEIWPDGRFVYRYDLSRCGGRGATALPDGGTGTTGILPVDGVTVGASFGDLAWTTNSLPTNVTSLAFYPLSPDDAVDQDRDGDGIPLIDELFAYGTDPDLWDTDGDGVSDGAEVALGTDPLVRDSGGDAPSGGTASPDFLSECGAAADRLVAWEIVPSAFSFARPEGFTNIVTRTFRVDRASPWQQLYVSSRANGAAGWESSDVSVRYVVDGGTVTNEVPSASADSWRLPLGPGPATNVTFIVEAAGGAPALSRPLHLLRWSPRVALAEDEAGRFLEMPEGKAPVFLSRRREESGWYVVPFTASFAGVPHVGGVDAAAAADLALPPCEALSVTNFPTRAFLASDPVWAELPPEGTNAAVRVCCWELAHETPGAIGSGPRASQFDSPYPLSSPALRKAFHRAKGIGAEPSVPVTVRILPSHPLVGLYVNAPPGPHLRGSSGSTNDVPGEVDVYPPSTLTPSFDHTPDGDDAYTLDATSPDEGVEESPAEDDDGGCGDPDPEKDDCDCADDGDGTSQCSFRLRISLGSPTPGENAGFVWTSLDEPTAVTPAVFNVLGTDAVAATTNALGEFTVTCSAPGGRTVQVANIEHGVALTVWNASGRLENRWEVTNPDGNEQYVRCRKLTILGNAVSDETFDLEDGMYGLNGVPDASRVADTFPDECVTRRDATRGVFTIKSKWRTDPDEPDFVTDVHDETVLEDWTSVSSVMSEFVKVGAGTLARRRLARRYGYDEKGPFSEEMAYWCDFENSYRHARLRSVRSDRRSWSFHDYDALGRETVCLEQLDGSPFPESLAEVSQLAELPRSCSARATVTSYEPQEGDSRDRNDAFLPRRRETWIMRAGKVPVLVGAETWLYTRASDAQGVALRTCVHASGAGETLRTETTVEYPEDDYAVPKELRGRTVSRVGPDGVTETSTVEKGTWDESSRTFTLGPDGAFLRTTTRRAGGGVERDTYDVSVEDALRRLTVFRATCLTSGDAVVAFEESAYDDIDRLRSTTYHDGTSLTNAYSCCRLLWWRDRQNRTTLRSAQTGTDHLYNAYEETWITNLTAATNHEPPTTNHAFRVTQHFYDALGRETNTVTYAGTTPGEAAVPIGEAALLPLQSAVGSQLVATATTTYPSGSDYYRVTIRTDERGKETRTWEDNYEECTQVDEKTHTNGVYLSGSTTTTMRNGAVTVRRGWYKPDGSYAWTEERRFTDYAPNGYRIDYVVTTSSDHPAVTNSVSTYDLLGRLVTTATPIGEAALSPLQSGPTGTTGVSPVANWLVTSNAYDGATSRILTTTKTGSLPVNYFYDEFGERIGMARGNKSVWNRTTYETVSQEVYRVVTTVRMTGSTTNSVQIQKTQLTGLSDACRRHTVTLTGTTGVPPVDGSVTDTLTTYDPATGIETTVSRTDGQTPVVTRSLHGVPIEQATRDERSVLFYDAFGRNVANVFENVATGATNRTEYIEYDISGNAVRQTVDYGADGVAVSTAEYDMLNREVRRTDALGHETVTQYDALGRPVFTDGDVYPIRTSYDTQGRKTGSSTTRDDGVTWDETQWEFDPASGVNTAKVYADGSRIAYSYTDNGQKTRTTWARGAWKQHAYNERNLVSGTTYSGTATPSVAYTYDDSDKLASATLSDGTSYAYTYDDSLLCTNEAMTIAEDNFTVMRTYDSFQRNEETAVVITNIRHAAKRRLYDSENRVCGYALTNSLGRGVNVAIAYDGSYVTNMIYTLPNGSQFAVNLMRKPSRKKLVTLRDYSYGGQSAYWYSTDYDLIGRPTNATDSVSLMREWQYNRRSELAAATIGMNQYGYEYDTIGNRLWSAANTATNTYSANSLNQYTTVGRVTPSAPQTTPLYDADGNMTNDGVFAYAYDAENRLVSATSASLTNGAICVLNVYDHRNRRIRKIVKRLYSTSAPPPAPPTGTDEWLTLETHTFVWDGNNIVLEKILFADGTIRTIENFWGLDKSGTEQGAGGVGGLLAVSMDGVFYIPCYDHNGNIVLYVSETGGIAAQYTYDPYGNIIASSGPLADVFSFGFSTKYHDRETGMINYKLRVLRPDFGRWLNRDPIEEGGGANLYCFVQNGSSYRHDYLGLSFGTIGPNSGSVVETFDGRSDRYSSDLWFAVYGDSSFNLRRYMKISGCKCDTKEPFEDLEYNYFSFPQGKMVFGQGKVRDNKWEEENIKFKEMYYAELISRSSTSLSEIKGTVEVRVQLTHSDVKPSDVVPNPSKDDEGFGTENNAPYGDQSREHPIMNFKIPKGSGWQPKGIIAEISFTLILDCDEGVRLKSAPKKTGDWALDGQNWHRAFGDGLPPRASGMMIEILP